MSLFIFLFINFTFKGKVNNRANKTLFTLDRWSGLYRTYADMSAYFLHILHLQSSIWAFSFFPLRMIF